MGLTLIVNVGVRRVLGAATIGGQSLQASTWVAVVFFTAVFCDRCVVWWWQFATLEWASLAGSDPLGRTSIGRP